MESSVRINKLTILLTWRPPLFFPSGEINGLNNFNYLPQCPLVLDQTASPEQTFLSPGWEVHKLFDSVYSPPPSVWFPCQRMPLLSSIPERTCSVFLIQFHSKYGKKCFHYVLGADAFLWIARPVCQFLLVLNFIQKCKKLRIARRSWKWTKLVDSCWKTSVIKTVWYWHKDKHWDRWNDLRIHK